MSYIASWLTGPRKNVIRSRVISRAISGAFIRGQVAWTGSWHAQVVQIDAVMSIHNASRPSSSLLHLPVMPSGPCGILMSTTRFVLATPASTPAARISTTTPAAASSAAMLIRGIIPDRHVILHASIGMAGKDLILAGLRKREDGE